MSKEIDAELRAIELAIDAFNGLDVESAKRALAYLEARFVRDAQKDRKKERSEPQGER